MLRWPVVLIKRPDRRAGSIAEELAIRARQDPPVPGLSRPGRRGALGTVTADDVPGFLVEVAPRRTAGTGNVVWSLKRFFAFLHAAGLSDVRIDGLLAHAAAAGAGAAVLHP